MWYIIQCTLVLLYHISYRTSSQKYQLVDSNLQSDSLLPTLLTIYCGKGGIYVPFFYILSFTKSSQISNFVDFNRHIQSWLYNKLANDLMYKLWQNEPRILTQLN